MTVKELAKELNFEVLTMPSPERVISGVYIGDLLSWVMGKVKQDDLWITIMSNINVVAVASLTDISCVLLSEDVNLEDDVLKTAKEKGVNFLKTSISSYEVAIRIAKVLQ